MFYLTQFCRICVQNKREMQHIDGSDYDAVTFSEKLHRICERMVISEQDHSRVICNECIQNLRISYAFSKMCARSDRLLAQYLDELTSVKRDEQLFINSELRVSIAPIPRIQVKIRSADGPQASTAARLHNRVNITRTLVRMGMTPAVHSNDANGTMRVRRKLKSDASFKISDAYRERLRKLCHNKLRITKEKRCIILRHLLQRGNKPDGEYIRWMPRKDSQLKQLLQTEEKKVVGGGKRWMLRTKSNESRQQHQNQHHRTIARMRKQAGGLRDLLGFIKDYDFGYVINESDIKEQCDPSALERLEAFSSTFFFSDFDAYRNTILSVANDSESSDEEDMFGPFDEEEDRQLWPECLDIPRIQIKQELFSLLCAESEVKQEKDVLQRDREDDSDEQLVVPSEFVQTCYEEEESSLESKQANFRYQINMAFQKRVKSRKVQKADVADVNLPKISVIPEASTSANYSLSSLEWLTRIANEENVRKVQDAPFSGKTIAPTHVKCRTRGNPFINPQLLQQFQMRTFKCDTCNRCFKSPGYLHSHCTKMGH